jgi:molybdate transport system ATP-binding protein
MTGVDVRATIARRNVDVEFGVAAGEVVAVLGENGAGKSTVLHVIAGLLRPDSGVVRCGDVVLTDAAGRMFVPAHARRMGLLLQDPLLFPHLSVLENVAFGPRSRHRSRRAARHAATHWLRQTDAAALADRAPRELSGGQAQRVALARALAAEPDVLLLDEPLAGLDVAAAAAIRSLLRGVLARDGRAALLVTHELLDVIALADRVLVLDSGRVVEDGPTARVLAAPRSAFAARLAGVNLVNGTIDSDGALCSPDGARWHGMGERLLAGKPAVVVFSPAAVSVYRDVPHGSPRNAVTVTIAELDTRGPGVRVRAADQADGAPGLAADVTTEAALELRLAPGDSVVFAIKAREVGIHPR